MNVNWIGLYTMFRREVERTMRVAIQTLVAPVISAALYIFIFGTVIGTKIEDFADVPYINFVFPGVLMLSIINASFASASSALYFMRFTKGIEEVLIAPFSYLEMLVGFVGAAVARAIMVAILILLVGLGFGAVSLVNPVGFFLYAAAIAAIFAMLGIIVALWAEGFEQLGSLNTFVITPLTFLSGTFYSVKKEGLPEWVATVSDFNPLFYMIDGFRYGFIGVSDAPIWRGALVSLVLAFGTILWTYILFKRGYKLKA